MPRNYYLQAVSQASDRPNEEIDGCWLYVLWPYKKYAQLITRHEVAGVTILAATVVTGNDFIIRRVLLSQPHSQPRPVYFWHFCIF